MFKFLKEKLKSAISIFSSKAEKEGDARETLEERPIAWKKEAEHIEEDMLAKPLEERKEPIEEKIAQSTGIQETEKETKTRAVEEKKNAAEKHLEKQEKEPVEKKAVIHEDIMPNREEKGSHEKGTGAALEESQQEKQSFFQRIKEKFAKPAEQKEGREQADEQLPESQEQKQEKPLREDDAQKRQNRPQQDLEIQEWKEPAAQKHDKPIAYGEKQSKDDSKPLQEIKSQSESRPPKEKGDTPGEQRAPHKTGYKEEKNVESTEEPKGFFAKLKERVQTVTISEDKFNEIFWGLEVVMLENNVAVEVIEKIKEDLREKLVDKPIRRGLVESTITGTLGKSIKGILSRFEPADMIKLASKKKPFVVCFVGVNGSGKTTTIAKMAYLFQHNNMSVVIAAADTFRAAAIDQLQTHADRLGVKLIKHDYGSDAAAVAFDAIKHAESKGRDIVLIDTAGRLHSNANLMEEMKKVVRVAKPDMVIFVGESITGNDCVEQARIFSSAVQIDGIILSKADVDEKGGAAISISYVTQKPILYIGTGQDYPDLKRFDPNAIVESLGLSA
jgi:fused signal recognition particle receptor